MRIVRQIFFQTIRQVRLKTRRKIKQQEGEYEALLNAFGIISFSNECLAMLQTEITVEQTEKENIILSVKFSEG